MIKPVQIRTWSRLGQRGTFFGVALPEMAEKKENLKLVTADLSLLSGMERFINQYPDKFLNVGIAEQNMIGIAAGLAMDDYCVVATTYASFIAVRSLEHVRQHLSHMQCNVKLVGSSAGVIAARSGVSHWATEDIAFMRALPNMIVLSAADSLDAYKMAEYALSNDRPMYIRLSGGLNCPIVNYEDYNFQVGKGVVLKKGDEVALVATGLMVAEALKAAELLEKDGISCTVVNMHTIKPIDTALLEELFRSHRLIVSLEEHQVIGGLGSAIAEYKATLDNMPKQLFVGFPDSFAKAGSQRYIWQQKNMTDEQIAQQVKSALT